MVGTGSRGTYLLKHLKGIDTGNCIAICDLTDDALNKATQTIGTNPKKYKDYRELLADKNVEAVFVTTPLFMHFPVTRDALDAGKNVFCEKSLVFKAEEVHALRALVNSKPKQVLQTGLQRRYSAVYQAARQMIEKGMLGEVTYVQAQWHRNPGWKMKKDVPNVRMANWRLFREYSGGLVAELASHQIDVADRMLGMTPEAVMGLGSRDFMNDGRDILDNVQLIYKYPKGRRLVWTGIPMSSHWAGVGGQHTEMGEMICGTQGTIHITVGNDDDIPIGMWFREPTPPPKVEEAGKKKEAFKAGATMVAAAGSRYLSILMNKDLMTGRGEFPREGNEVRPDVALPKGHHGASRRTQSRRHRTRALLQRLPHRRPSAGRPRGRLADHRCHPLQPRSRRKPHGLLQRNREDGQVPRRSGRQAHREKGISREFSLYRDAKGRPSGWPSCFRYAGSQSLISGIG